MGKREDYQRAVDLIKAGDLEAAANILIFIDHPKADRLLDKVNRTLAARGQSTPAQRPATPPPQPTFGDSQRADQKSGRSCLRLIAWTIIAAFFCTFGVFYLTDDGLTSTGPNTASRNSEQRDSSPAPSLAETEKEIVNTLDWWVSSADIQSVRAVDTRNRGGERGVFVTYNTNEIDPDELLAEMVSIFEAVGRTTSNNGLDLDSVVLIVQDSFGAQAGMFIADMPDIVAYYNGDLSRSRFINRISPAEL